MRRIRQHLTYANLMSTIAVFLVLGGGTAIAAFVVNSNADVATNTISGHRPPSGDHSNIIGGSVDAIDVANEAISGHNPPSDTGGTDIAGNSVNGEDIQDGSLSFADLAPSAQSKGRWTTKAQCNPNSTTVADCGSMTINLAQTSRVLVVASAMWWSAGPTGGTGGQGTCRIGVNGAPFGPDASPGEATDNSSAALQQSLTLTAVTDPNLGPGPHTFGLACNDRHFNGGDIVYGPTYVSAVVLGPG